MEDYQFVSVREEDFPKVAEFYRYVAENTDTMPRYGRWIYGLHPTDEMIAGYCDAGVQYLLMAGDTIAAAVAVTMCQGADYHNTPWQKALRDDEVAVVHLLCVNPAMQKQGVAKAAMAHVMALAAKAGKQAVRLDALSCNTPAHRLYEGLGFARMGTEHWYADNVGWTDFYLYEKLL